MIKIKADWLFNNTRFIGLTIAPFVFYKSQKSYTGTREYFWAHEKIHIKQQYELLIIPFFILYVIFWIFKGYKNNPFEVEANKFEKNPKDRKPYGWLF